MNRFTSTSALPLCLLLAACGGGGDGTFIASTPPPPLTQTPTPTPTPTLASGTVTYVYPSTNPIDIKRSWLDSPATRNGNYDLIGRLTLNPGNGGSTSYRAATPGEFTMSVANATDGALSYRLNAPAGILPSGLTSSAVGSAGISWDINSTVAYRYTNIYGDTPQYFGQRLAGFGKAADGSETQLFSYDFTRGLSGFQQPLGDKYLRTTLDYDIGYSYVAMGEWSWRVVDLSGAAAGDSGDLLFVNGDRTPASGIPISGTATYDAHSLTLWSNGDRGIPFSLTADFGGRTISTRIDQDYLYLSQVDGSNQGIHVGGSAPFSNNGLFDIPLSGTVNYSSTNSPVTPPSQAVTGGMNGAFFGPHAEQVGGTFSLQNSGGTLLMQDAFVGKQH
ncbi:MAG: transferrin-binding protein-like solute binding protein [Sphingomicrobium sp.]